jgi:hypothetical protein
MADEQKTPAGDKQRKKDLVETAKRRFQMSAEAESRIREEALDDLKFRAGDQWPDKIKNQRGIDGRPCLTINQIPQFLRHVTNDQRQNRPSIQVNPVGDGGDQDTAEIIQGIVRHIEYDSGADAAYDTAFQSAVTGGFGYFRILTEYEDPMSFDQVIKIKRVLNPFTVYMDPNAKEPDRSDARFCFVVERYTRDEYKELYPDSEMSAMDDWGSVGDGWADKDSCRVVEYFYKESVDKTIVLLHNPVSGSKTTIAKDQIPKNLPEGLKILAERKTKVDAIKWAKINGVETLDETDFPGQWLPVIPVLGDELDIDGELVLEGVVRNAKQPQQQYNFMASASTEAIALAPKAPYVAAEGQLEGHESDWQQANVKNLSVLLYKAKSLDGQPLPPPQRQTIEPAIQATTMAMMQASADLKNVTGIYEAALGQDGNEKSGKAILARQSQSNGANFHYVDNLSRSMRHAGRIIVGLIPVIYDTPRVLRIIREDGSQDTVAINTPPEKSTAAQNVKRLYDLTVGKYDVTISTGPSYQTKRQEAVSSMLQLVSSFPAIIPIAGDLLVGNMDWPGAQKIAERLKKALPPQFQDNPDGAVANLPPEVQQHIAQMTQQLQQTQQGLMAATKDVQDQVSAKHVELESKERIEFAKLDVEKQKLDIERQKVQASILTAQATIDAKRADANAQREFNALTAQTDNAHEYAMSAHEHEQSQQMAAQQQAAAPQQQQQQPGGGQ